jgi:hypothetical protein
MRKKSHTATDVTLDTDDFLDPKDRLDILAVSERDDLCEISLRGTERTILHELRDTFGTHAPSPRLTYSRIVAGSDRYDKRRFVRSSRCLRLGFVICSVGVGAYSQKIGSKSQDVLRSLADKYRKKWPSQLADELNEIVAFVARRLDFSLGRRINNRYDEQKQKRAVGSGLCAQ